MHIAIDDSYGPVDAKPSKYVTGARRTYVAVEFPDSQVTEVRHGIEECLTAVPDLMGVSPTEFHFTDIYNRRGIWKNCLENHNLSIFKTFAEIYKNYRWKVHLQTVDDRTLSDHKLMMSDSVDGINLGTREGQALFLLLLKLKKAVPQPPEKLVVRIDAGLGKPGDAFANNVFREWRGLYDGCFANSNAEPLVQIADFLAYIINRSTHLMLKPKLNDIDLWFLDLVSRMEIQSVDLVRRAVNPNCLGAEADAVHLEDRRKKGLE